MVSKLNVLVVNNTIFYEDTEGLYVNKETGKFCVSLVKDHQKVSMFQLSQERLATDSFANYNLLDKGLNFYKVKRNKSRIIAFMKAFFVIQKAIFKNDFVYIYYPGPICKVIAFFCYLYNKPFGLYVRGEQDINTKFSNFLIKEADFVLTISPKFTSNLLEVNSKCYTIKPMIGFSKDDSMKVHRSFKFEILNLIFVGRVVYDKGIFELLEAIRIINLSSHKVNLKIVGDGPDIIEVKSMISEYSLDYCVSLHGMISDKNILIDLYKSSEILILPTYHEGFPRVLYEAMLMKLGIITTFVGTIDYLMRDNVNCVRIDVKSTESIVEAIDRFLKDSSLLRDLVNGSDNTIKDYLKDKDLDHADQVSKLIKEYAS